MSQFYGQFRSEWHAEELATWLHLQATDECMQSPSNHERLIQQLYKQHNIFSSWGPQDHYYYACLYNK
jgi:hypothetical protein